MRTYTRQVLFQIANKENKQHKTLYFLQALVLQKSITKAEQGSSGKLLGMEQNSIKVFRLFKFSLLIVGQEPEKTTVFFLQLTPCAIAFLIIGALS